MDFFPPIIGFSSDKATQRLGRLDTHPAPCSPSGDVLQAEGGDITDVGTCFRTRVET